MVWASGGVAGALGDRAERVGQGVPERSAPDDGDVDRFEDLDLYGSRREVGFTGLRPHAPLWVSSSYLHAC